MIKTHKQLEAEWGLKRYVAALMEFTNIKVERFFGQPVPHETMAGWAKNSPDVYEIAKIHAVQQGCIVDVENLRN